MTVRRHLFLAVALASIGWSACAGSATNAPGNISGNDGRPTAATHHSLRGVAGIEELMIGQWEADFRADAGDPSLTDEQRAAMSDIVNNTQSLFEFHADHRIEAELTLFGEVDYRNGTWAVDVDHGTTGVISVLMDGNASFIDVVFIDSNTFEILDDEGEPTRYRRRAGIVFLPNRPRWRDDAPDRGRALNGDQDFGDGELLVGRWSAEVLNLADDPSLSPVEQREFRRELVTTGSYVELRFEAGGELRMVGSLLGDAIDDSGRWAWIEQDDRTARVRMHIDGEDPTIEEFEFQSPNAFILDDGYTRMRFVRVD